MVDGKVAKRKSDPEEEGRNIKRLMVKWRTRRIANGQTCLAHRVPESPPVVAKGMPRVKEVTRITLVFLQCFFVFFRLNKDRSPLSASFWFQWIRAKPKTQTKNPVADLRPVQLKLKVYSGKNVRRWSRVVLHILRFVWYMVELFAAGNILHTTHWVLRFIPAGDQDHNSALVCCNAREQDTYLHPWDWSSQMCPMVLQPSPRRGKPFSKKVIFGIHVSKQVDKNMFVVSCPTWFSGIFGFCKSVARQSQDYAALLNVYKSCCFAEQPTLIVMIPSGAGQRLGSNCGLRWLLWTFRLQVQRHTRPNAAEERPERLPWNAMTLINRMDVTVYKMVSSC